MLVKQNRHTMIPIRDHNPSSTFPFITYSLIAINVVVFVFMMSLSADELDVFVASYALIPAHIVAGFGFFTLLSSMFLHGSIGHLLGNMLFLYIFGDNLEDRLGHLKFLLFYLIAGLCASALQMLTDPHSIIPNLGASGAIAGAMGGYLRLFPKHRIDVLFPFGFMYQQMNVPAYTMLFYWIVVQFLGGIGSLTIEGGGIAYFAHVGGFISGFLMMLFVRRK